MRHTRQSFFGGLLVALLVVACSKDLRTSPTIRADLDCAGSSCTGGALTFKVQAGSTWYPLVAVGDKIATSSTSGYWTIVSGGATNSVLGSAVTIDTVGYGAGIRQLKMTSTPDLFLFNAGASTYSVYEGNTATADTLSLVEIAGDPLDPDSTKWRYVTWDISPHVKDTDVTLWQSAFDLDVTVGTVRFAKCSSTPTCTWAN